MKPRKYAAAAVLFVLVVSIVLVVLLLSNVQPEPIVVEPVLLEPPNWESELPYDQSYSMSFDYQDVLHGLCLDDGFINMSLVIWDYFDLLHLGLNVTAELGQGYIENINLTARKSHAASYLWWKTMYPGLRLENLTLASDGRPSFVTFNGVNRPRRASLQTFPDWNPNSPYNQTERLTIRVEVAYFNGTSYKKVICPFNLKLIAYNNFSFETAEKLKLNTTDLERLLGGDNWEDFYKVYLEEGRTLNIDMTPPAGSNFDLYVYSPNDLNDPVYNSTNESGATESISFTADMTGWWFIKVLFNGGSGLYVFNAHARPYSPRFDISAQYNTFVSARVNYMQIFGQNVSVGETVERDLSDYIDDPSPHYEWVTWAGHTYPSHDGFSIRIETIQQDYVYKIIGLGHVGGSQPSASGWIQVNAPFEIKQVNYIRNSTREDNSYFRVYIDEATGSVDFESKWYNYPALIDACAFGFAFTIAKPEGTLPPFSNDTSRAGASYAYDTAANRVVMYGGTTILEGDFNAGVFNSDVWTYDPVTSQWATISTSNYPPGRKYASMSYNSLADNFLLFGGSTSKRGMSDETWIFQFTDSTSGTWTQIINAGPSERRLASMAYDADDDLFVLFGGGKSVYTYGDTWLFNPTTNSWTNATPSISPAGRLGARMVYDVQSGLILMFGGMDKVAGSLLNDTWLYNATSNSWQQIYPMTTPSARLYPSLASDGNGHVYLFGGWDMGSNGLSNYLDDTWRFDVATMEWTELDPPSRPPPQSQGNLICIDTGQFVLMNGWRDCPLGDIWFYSADENTWSS